MYARFLEGLIEAAPPGSIDRLKRVLNSPAYKSGGDKSEQVMYKFNIVNHRHLGIPNKGRNYIRKPKSMGGKTSWRDSPKINRGY